MFLLWYSRGVAFLYSRVVFVFKSKLQMFTCGTDRRGIVAEEALAGACDIRWFSPSTADGPSNQWSGGAESIFNKSILSAWNSPRPAQPLTLLLASHCQPTLTSRKARVVRKGVSHETPFQRLGSDSASLAEHWHGGKTDWNWKSITLENAQPRFAQVCQ